MFSFILTQKNRNNELAFLIVMKHMQKTVFSKSI